MVKLVLNCTMNHEDLGKLTDGLNKAIKMRPMVNPPYRRVVIVTCSESKYFIKVMDYSEAGGNLHPKFATRQYNLDDLITS